MKWSQFDLSLKFGERQQYKAIKIR